MMIVVGMVVVVDIVVMVVNVVMFLDIIIVILVARVAMAMVMQWRERCSGMECGPWVLLIPGIYVNRTF